MEKSEWCESAQCRGHRGVWAQAVKYKSSHCEKLLRPKLKSDFFRLHFGCACDMRVIRRQFLFLCDNSDASICQAWPLSDDWHLNRNPSTINNDQPKEGREREREEKCNLWREAIFVFLVAKLFSAFAIYRRCYNWIFEFEKAPANWYLWCTHC